MPSMQHHQVDNKKTMLLQKAKKIPTSTQSDLKAAAAVDMSYGPVTTPTADLLVHNEQLQAQEESAAAGIVLQIYTLLSTRRY